MRHPFFETFPMHTAARSLQEAQVGELVAVKGSYSEPYWFGLVKEVTPQKQLLCVYSERFTHGVEGHWYNWQGLYTNANGRVHKRVPWGVGTIEVLTDAIRAEIAHQVEMEKLTGFRTAHYGLLKEADLEQLQAVVAHFTRDVPLPLKKQPYRLDGLPMLILGVITRLSRTNRIISASMITEQVEHLGFEQVWLLSDVPTTDYELALAQLIEAGEIEVDPRCHGSRYFYCLREHEEER